MITLKSTYKEFIDLCVSTNPCSQSTFGFTYMVDIDKKLSTEESPLMFADGLKLFIEDKSMGDFHTVWILKTVGKDLDVKVRKLFISKLTNPMECAKLFIDCPYLTDEEDVLLKNKFEGQLPTVEKELATNIITRAKVSK